MSQLFASLSQKSNPHLPSTNPALNNFSETFPGPAGYFLQREQWFLENNNLNDMKYSPCRSLALAVAVTALSLNLHAGTTAGEVDFGKFTAPAKGGEFVEVQIKSNLIGIAAKLVEKEEPDAAKLLRSVEMVRVNVVGLTDENRDEMEKRVEQIRKDLDGGGWDRNVNVKGEKGEDVGVYTKTRGSDALSGLVVTVIEAEHVVLVNIVGDIKPEQVTAIGEKLNIKPLKEIGGAIEKDKEK
jgi:hypothetical protein